MKVKKVITPPETVLAVVKLSRSEVKALVKWGGLATSNYKLFSDLDDLAQRMEGETGED